MGTSIAGLEGVIAGESEICYIDGYQGILSYRGFNIHTLADNASFEEVIFLLWNGWLPTAAQLDQLKKDLVAERGLPAGVIDFLKGVPPFPCSACTIPRRRTCPPRPTIVRPCG
jgi:citrate synthase